MSADAYSPIKAFRHLDVVQAIQQHKATRPVHVQIIPSDLCNHACAFCSYRDPSYSSSQKFFEVDVGNLKRGLRRDTTHPERNYNPNRMIPIEKLQEILDDCRTMGVRAIQYTGGGEPTVHPSFRRLLAMTHERGLQFSVVSNGVNISRKGYADAVARAAWTRISIDAAYPHTYAKMRGVDESHFEDAWKAIVDIKTARETLGTDCVIGVGFVVTPDNWREVSNAALRARFFGADNIRISAQFSTQDEKLFAGFAAECAELCKQAESLQTDTFKVYNRFSARVDDLKLKRPDYKLCGYQFFTTYIGADQNVYRCCVQSYNDHGLVGSIKETRFADLWLDPARSASMRSFDAGSCDRCQFNNINRPLAYVLDDSIQLHEEFV